jgi:hypothetical protein
VEHRGQFTFYRSFWEAVQELPKKDRLPILEAIISYALDGAIPAGMTKGQSAFFLLVKPNLDIARKKAANGKQGGSKPKANDKQTESKKENEKENENEIEKENEIEGEKYKEQTPSTGSMFEQFWMNYPDQRDREGAEEAWKKLNPDTTLAERIMVELDAWKDSAQWNDQGGAFIPMAANWLNKGYWMKPPVTMFDSSSVAGECVGTEEYIRQVLQKRGHGT